MVVIGSGNVAWHMVHAFSEAGINVLQVLARNEQSARKLSGAFSVPYIMDPEKIHREADIYLLAVQDDQIRNAASKLHLKDQFLVHTSGFSALDVLKGASSNYGVLWPLQSLTAGRKVNYSSIPLFIEANTPENETALNELGICIQKK